MTELIKIQKKKGIQTVNARELWEKLVTSKTQFTHWIQDRLEGFQEGADFLLILAKTSELGGRPAKEYYLTIETAKHICMMERNDIGKQIRQYFIDEEMKTNDPAFKKIRDKSKEKRITFTDTLKGHGCSKPGHYIGITKSMKNNLGIDKKKERCNKIELQKIMVSEDLATLQMMINNPDGYHECRPICDESASIVKQVSDKAQRLRLA